jgi:hypothetical protein
MFCQSKQVSASIDMRKLTLENIYSANQRLRLPFCFDNQIFGHNTEIAQSHKFYRQAGRHKTKLQTLVKT